MRSHFGRSGLPEARWVTPDNLRPVLKSSDAVAALSVEIECFPDTGFDKLELSSLPLYLNGESSLIHTLYELLCNNCAQIVLRDRTPNTRKAPITLPAGYLRPAGFGMVKHCCHILGGHFQAIGFCRNIFVSRRSFSLSS